TMKSIALVLALSLVAATALPGTAEARRFGGGGGAGMQRSMPTAAPSALPAKPGAPMAQTAPTAAAAAAPAAAAKRSWMGPIAGLAAGLGIAALMSHLGLGAAFGNIIMMVLLGIVAFVAVRFLMRRFMPANGGANGGMQLAGAGAGAGAAAPSPAIPRTFVDERPEHLRGLPAGGGAPAAGALAPVAVGAAAAATVATLPAGFDVTGFERIAKMIFIRMQAANDSGDLSDLRAFTTPEMFANVKLELQERGSASQTTDVVRVDAQVLDVASEADRQIVSVRFHGLIREEIDGAAAPFDEIWHLVKPADGSREWAIAGIQQAAQAT
ncbi:MAG: TIM44-like domain-containing protein, partial [Caldimonas sp.]